MRKISARYLICLASLVFSVVMLIISYIRFRPLPYSFFIEFENSHGIIKGTSIRMRGVSIGTVQSIKLKADSVIVLAVINSNKIFIPIDSLIETTQTGLLNESVIDIIPSNFLFFEKKQKLMNPVSKSCDSSYLICNYSYVKGDRGLNYDDLVRSTTRISQRFDDPRFFNLLYVFLHNGIELIDGLSEFSNTILDVISIIYIYFEYFLSENIYSELK